MGPLETMQKHYEQRDAAAREWKGRGGKVVGYLSDDVPEEMIPAAGLFPFRMSGDPSGGTEEADRYTETFYDPSVRSILNMILAGKYDFLDFIIIPHASDSILKLYHQMWWIHRINPAITFPPVHLFDILHLPLYTTGLYVRDRVRELKAKLEEWSGNGLTDEALARTIALGNENRSLLKRVAALRAAEPPYLTGSQALRIIGTSTFMPKEEHNRLLKQFLEETDRLPVKEGVRLFIEGSDLDNVQLYELIESCGAVVVAEDSNWGNRYFEDPADESCDPLDAIVDRYHLRPSRIRIQSIDQRVGYCTRRVAEARAQGVVFFIYEWDPAPAWDFPDQRKALEAMGIPTLAFNAQKYVLSGRKKQEIRDEVRQFIETIRTRDC